MILSCVAGAKGGRRLSRKEKRSDDFLTRHLNSPRISVLDEESRQASVDVFNYCNKILEYVACRFTSNCRDMHRGEIEVLEITQMTRIKRRYLVLRWSNCYKYL